MMLPPYYIASAKMFQDGELLSELSAVFSAAACLPDWRIFPAKMTDCTWTLECLQDREEHTAYVTAWRNANDHFVIYFISLYQRSVNGASCFIRQFSGFRAFYDYCNEQMNDRVKMDYSRLLQYETYLEASYRPGKTRKKHK